MIKNTRVEQLRALLVDQPPGVCVLVPWHPDRSQPILWLRGEVVNVGAAALILSGQPKPSPAHVCCHAPVVCHNGRCVQLEHLRWGTQAENMADRLEDGTHHRGERCPTAKLTESQVREILALRGAMLQREIAARYGVSPSLISLIHSREVWAHIVI